jgi:hypothetical protein
VLGIAGAVIEGWISSVNFGGDRNTFNIPGFHGRGSRGSPAAVPLSRDDGKQESAVRMRPDIEPRPACGWHLKGCNGRIVAASSERYRDKADCEHAIELIEEGIATGGGEGKM